MKRCNTMLTAGSHIGCYSEDYRKYILNDRKESEMITYDKLGYKRNNDYTAGDRTERWHLQKRQVDSYVSKLKTEVREMSGKINKGKNIYSDHACKTQGLCGSNISNNEDTNIALENLDKIWHEKNNNVEDLMQIFSLNEGIKIDQKNFNKNRVSNNNIEVYNSEHNNVYSDRSDRFVGAKKRCIPFFSFHKNNS